MKKLLVFQLIRFKNKNILLLMPGLLLGIGFMGLLLGVMVYGINAAPEMWLVSVYNAYTQFTFLFLINIFVSTFSDDFTNGIYNFMRQIGCSFKQCIWSKAICIYFMTFIGTNVFILFTYFISANNDIKYLSTIMISVNFSLIFIILFAIILSLTIKKTMTATLIGYGSFLIMNILNFIGFGLTNPADGNSISSVTIRFLAGGSLDHYSLKTTNIDFQKYGFLLAILPVVAWDFILLMMVFFLIKREGKKNEI